MKRAKVWIPLLALVLLSGCGSLMKRDEAPPAPAPEATPAKPAPEGGAYYLDDGPGANPPPNLDAIPDAIPRAEPLSRAANRPYTAFNRNYTPMTDITPYKASGIASWYGRRYHGQRTASGELYDMYGMTAAHPTLPIPSFARVTSNANGRSVVVRVNDRGPFRNDRLIDLSYAAAHRLDLVRPGQGEVTVELIDPRAPAPPPQPAPAPVVAAKPAPKGPAVYLQLGAFGVRENAENFVTRVRSQLDWLGPLLGVAARDGLFRVQAGPYSGSDEARAAAERIRGEMGIDSLLVGR